MSMPGVLLLYYLLVDYVMTSLDVTAANYCTFTIAAYTIELGRTIIIAIAIPSLTVPIAISITECISKT